MKNPHKVNRTANIAALAIIAFALALASPIAAQDKDSGINIPMSSPSAVPPMGEGTVGNSIRPEKGQPNDAPAPVAQPPSTDDMTGDSISVTGGVPGSTTSGSPSTSDTQPSTAASAPPTSVPVSPAPAEASAPAAPAPVSPAPSEASAPPAPTAPTAEIPQNPAPAEPPVASAPAAANPIESAPSAPPVASAPAAPSGIPRNTAPPIASAPENIPDAAPEAPVTASEPTAAEPAPAAMPSTAPAPEAAAPISTPVTTAAMPPSGTLAPPMVLAPVPAEVAPDAAPATASAPETAAAENAPQSKQSGKHAAKVGKGNKVASNAPNENPLGLQFGNSKGPIDIKSESMSLDYQNHSVLWSGHVHANQANAQLTSDNLRVNYFDKDFKDLKDMVADGNVRISQGTRWATGQHGVMDQTKRTMVLTGSPVVHDCANQITGKRITVFLDTSKSVVEGAHAVIFPHQGQDGDNATPTGCQ